MQGGENEMDGAYSLPIFAQPNVGILLGIISKISTYGEKLK
jgi:hypothetical protein